MVGLTEGVIHCSYRIILCKRAEKLESSKEIDINHFHSLFIIPIFDNILENTLNCYFENSQGEILKKEKVKTIKIFSSLSLKLT